MKGRLIRGRVVRSEGEYGIIIDIDDSQNENVYKIVFLPPACGLESVEQKEVSRYQILDEIAPENMIKAAEQAVILEKYDLEVFNREVARLRKAPEYKHLTTKGEGRLLENLRRDLLKNFPAARFRVDHSELTETVFITWVCADDSITKEAIRKITNKYLLGVIIDHEYRYKRNPFAHVYGGAFKIEISSPPPWTFD